MRKIFSKQLLSLLLIFTLTFSSFLLTGCGTNKTTAANADASGQNTETAAQPTEAPTEPPTEPQPVEINIMMIGDMLVHEGVYNSGKQGDGTYNYDHLFKNILSDIDAADIRIVNQETILGGLELGLSGYPCFNSPYELGDAEVKAGFNVVLHATNHTIDKGLTGVENCLNFWSTNHPETTVLGINETEEDYNDIYVYEKEGFKVAILNYTYGTNGIPIPSSKPYIVNMLDDEKITQDVTKAKQIADMVVVCPHWGTEYVYQPDSNQKHWTQLFLNLGVDVVIGSHPHVMENVEVLTGDDGHQMLVYYSLGNFVSNQDQKPRMIGGMANVTLVKHKDECYVKEYSYTPIVTHKLFGPSLITSYKLEDYTEELAAANSIRNDSGCYDFSLQYCKDLAKQVLGDDYNEETCKLHVKLRE